ncbi:MAG: type II toxin-antitoxin system RelE/ParE family toxin [Patescibacteria group bacterium]
MHKIKFASEQVKKQFDKLPISVFKQADKVIISLTKNPFPEGVKKLKSLGDFYRIRISDFRVIYKINHKNQEIIIMRVKHRKDVYKHFP